MLAQMAQALSSGEVDAAVPPEPFASQAELSLGTELLADLDSGATTSFPVRGCAVTREWAQANPLTLAEFTKAYDQGQEIAGTNRAANICFPGDVRLYPCVCLHEHYAMCARSGNDAETSLLMTGLQSSRWIKLVPISANASPFLFQPSARAADGILISLMSARAFDASC
jgi:hypothetical protein